MTLCTITTALRASVVAGLIGATALGACGAAAAQPGMTGPVLSAHSLSSAGHLVVGDVDDDGGYDGGYDGGGYDSGSADVVEEQPAAPAAESEPQIEAPQDEAPADEAPADEAPAQPDIEEPADVPSAEPADGPADEPTAAPTDETPEQTPAPEQAPAPVTPDAPPSPQDVDTAQHATPVEADPAPAPAATVDQIRTEITNELTSSTSVTTWNREVTQWNSSWLSYDAYYRPIMVNPYRSAIQLVYTYDNATRIVTVDPLQSVVVDVPTVGVYGFTAVVRSTTGAITGVTVGSFTGGGYVPAAGHPRPVKPKAPPTVDNALVRIVYANGVSRPFRVKHLADLGDDTTAHARRVLIDGTTSAWGRWTTAAGGEKEFDITMTLQLPGLAGPTQAPLPGYGAVPLAAAPRRAR